jgi:hypothetical protein
MISGKIKKDLLNELKKFGNVFFSCSKIGVDKSTYYRWKQKNEKFKEQAEEAIRIGRENICDVAEHALLKNIKDGEQRAIEYGLSHNSERYRQKRVSDVVILHKKEVLGSNPEVKTIEDLFDDYDKKQLEGEK